MPKLLVEGYRPTKGDGGPWVGVMDDTQPIGRPRSPDKTRAGTVLPHGGSAIGKATAGSTLTQSNKQK
jgi:hypothetical protein